ncbi:MAG: hypothetical protein QMB98_08575, partial [Flaviflexus sp.]
FESPTMTPNNLHHHRCWQPRRNLHHTKGLTQRYEDWKLDDPAGQGIVAVRPIRDEIKARIEELIASLD